MEKEKIYLVLVNAKEIYEKHYFIGMCGCIKMALDNSGESIIFIEHIPKFIPEFNRHYLNAAYSAKAYWWDTDDRTSRLNAFDKLINHYKS